MGFRGFLGGGLVVRSDPHRPEIAIRWFFFRPFWAFGTWRHSGPGRKTQKRNFPALEALLGEKIRPPERFLLEIPRLLFLRFTFWPTGAHGRGIAETLLVFSPVWRLALGEIPGGNQENRTRRAPGGPHSERGPETERIFSGNDAGPFGVSLEVFLARSEGGV